MASVTALLRAHKRGDKRSLVALAAALHQACCDTPEPALDPTELLDVVEDRGAELAGSWQQVRAARDFGDLTAAEYDYLAAAVEAMDEGTPG